MKSPDGTISYRKYFLGAMNKKISYNWRHGMHGIHRLLNISESAKNSKFDQNNFTSTVN